MNWLKKFLSGPASGNAVLRPRHPRVSLGPLHRVSFRAIDGDELLLENISQGGMSLLSPTGVPAPGDQITGQLKIDKDRYDLAATVRHRSARAAGVEFYKPKPELLGAIERYLRLEFLAMKLRRVDDAYLKADPRGDVVWLTDGNQNEVFAVINNGSLVTFHLTFLGHHVRGDHDSRVQVGAVSEDENTQPGWKGSDLIVEAAVAPKEVLRLALVFISNAADIPDDLRALLVARLSE